MPSQTDLKPYLRFMAGSDWNNMQEVQVNRFPVAINNEFFEGILIVRIKNFDESNLKDAHHYPDQSFLNADEYFGDRSRQFSFQVEGRFKQPVNGDDLYWDISFPTKIHGLPFFTPMVVKFLQYLDPATEIDFYSEKRQFVRSSVLTMMNSLSAWKPKPLSNEERRVLHEVDDEQSLDGNSSTTTGGDDADSINGPATVPVEGDGTDEGIVHPETLQNGVAEDLTLIVSSIRRLSAASAGGSPTTPTSINSTSSSKSKAPAEPPRHDPVKRRKYFLQKDNRERVTFYPEYVYAFESFNPHMCWTDFTAKIPGFNIDVKKYFKGGKAVRINLCSKDGSRIYCCMEGALVENEA
ncbi:hypothetical protein HDU85_004306 [Gaertneriomyces sp. JEL0708]|nr:hypothetical protein HDU85_004306 [Gaertneriomyces sp. JEL0708]